MQHIYTGAAALALVLLSGSSARAQEVIGPQSPPEADRPAAASEPAPPAAKPAPEPYVSPFQLRGVNPGTAVRLDTTVAPFTDSTTKASANQTVSLLSASAKLSSHVAASMRIGAVRTDIDAPDGKGPSTGFTNLNLGVMYGTTFGRHVRLAMNTGVALPTASGGGNNGDPAMAAAMKSGMYTRAMMDNGMFTIQDVGVPFGLDLAYTRYGLTVQVETTVIPTVRVRGEAKQTDSTKVNSTSAFFVGYYILPSRLSVGGELHYQRFLSTPAAVAKDESMRSNLSVSGGVRTYFKVASNVTFRPGVSVGTGLAGAIADRGYQMVQVDVPFAF